MDLIHQLKIIKLLGGEPVIQPEVIKILNNIDNHARIQITTNGYNFNNNFIKSIKNKNVHFYISLDGIEEVYEYIRYPGKWYVVNQNIIFLLENNYPVTLKFVVQFYNIFKLGKILEYCDNLLKKYPNNLKFFFSPVNEEYLHFN